MRNICRPFIFYNNYWLSEKREGDNACDYLAFGYYDEVSVGGNLFQETKCSIESLWEYEKERLQMLEGQYSEKIIFGFRSETDDSDCTYIRDDKLWEKAEGEKTKYPFIFVSVLHMKTEKPDMSLSNRVKIEKALTVEGRRLAITYLTLGDGDMILVLLCKCYKDGREILDSFHRKEEASFLGSCEWNFAYSFTVAGIQKESLNKNLQDVAADQIENISQAYIYMMEKKLGSVDYVYEEMKTQLLCKKNTNTGGVIEKESVLGCNDEVIVVKNISWELFLEFFQDKKGILNSQNLFYKDHLIGITTIIAHPQQQSKKAEGYREGTENTPLLSVKLKKMIEILKQMDSVYKKPFENISRYLCQIINSLQKAEKLPFLDYALVSAFLPLNMVMQISEIVGRKEDETLAGEFYSCFYEFIRGLNIYIQNMAYLDRQFIQIINFDFKTYYTPVKMTAFYNAFIYALKNYLDSINGENGQKHEYEFLLCLGATGNMEVQELFQGMSDTKRLFLVYIPEDQSYKPKQMLIMLGHEVGHFVGQKIRSREKRLECAINIMAKIMVRYLRDCVKDQVDDGAESQYLQKEEYWSGLEKKWVNLIKYYLENRGKKNYIKNEIFIGCDDEKADQFSEQYKKTRTYTYVLGRTMADSCVEILKKHGEELFSYLIEQDYLYWIKNDASCAEKKKREISVNLAKAAEELLQESVWSRHQTSLSSIIRGMMYLFKECVADLIGILTLKIQMEDYLYAMQQAVESQGQEERIVGGIDLLRSAMVVYCMAYPGEHDAGHENVFQWDFEEFDKEEKMTGNAEKLKRKIAECIDRYLTSDDGMVLKKEDPLFENKDTEIYLFWDTGVLIELQKYLLHCRDRLNFFYEKRLSERLHPFYQIFQEPEAEKMIIEIEKHITDYYSKIWGEIIQDTQEDH